MTPISLDAPAKLNLSLRVVGHRPDGYHLLETNMVLLELADRLLLMPGAGGLRVEAADDEAIPLGPENLAWRGLVAGFGHEPGLGLLALEKRIPAAAGLGGGSSDAAAGWRLGRRAAAMPEAPSGADLASLSLLGADVPFFAAMTPSAAVSGIGEVVVPVSMPSAACAVLAVPPFRLSTAAVFAELRPSDLDDDRESANDLLAPALRLRPELGDLLRAVAAAGGEPRLSGSGSTIFTLSDDPERCAAIASRLRQGPLRVIETRLRSEPAEIVELGEPPDDAGVPLPSMG